MSHALSTNYRAGDALNAQLGVLREHASAYAISHGQIGTIAYKDWTILFQDGPIGDGTPNGISDEVLLAILIDRLHSFQSGPLKCRENALAITKLEEAMHWLHHRTRDRIERGVEGTNQP